MFEQKCSKGQVEEKKYEKGESTSKDAKCQKRAKLSQMEGSEHVKSI